MAERVRVISALGSATSTSPAIKAREPPGPFPVEQIGGRCVSSTSLAESISRCGPLTTRSMPQSAAPSASSPAA
jgi:hypothetical protein